VIGPNDKVVIDRYDDPKVENAACYVSRAETGGISGAVGLAEDPSRFSIACRRSVRCGSSATSTRARMASWSFSARTSAVFKCHARHPGSSTRRRMSLVYLVTSTKVVEGSALPLDLGGAAQRMMRIRRT